MAINIHTRGAPRPASKRARGKVYITPEFINYMDNKMKALEKDPGTYVRANSRAVAKDLGIEPYAAILGITAYTDLVRGKYNVDVTNSGVAYTKMTRADKARLKVEPPQYRNIHPDDIATIDAYVSRTAAPILVNSVALARAGLDLKTRPACQWILYQTYFAMRPKHHLCWVGVMTLYENHTDKGEYISYIIGPGQLDNPEGSSLARRLCASAGAEP